MKRYILQYIACSLVMMGCSEALVEDTTPSDCATATNEIVVTLGVADGDNLISRVSTTTDSKFENPWIVEWEAYDKVLLIGNDTNQSILSMTKYDSDASTFDGDIDGDITSARIFYPTHNCNMSGGKVTISYENVLSQCRYPAMVSEEITIELSEGCATINDEIQMAHIGGAMDLQFSFEGLSESKKYQLISLTLDSGSATIYNKATLDYDFTTPLTTSDTRMSKGAINISVEDMAVENDTQYSAIFNILPFEVADGEYISVMATLLCSEGLIYTCSFEKRNSTGSDVSFARGTHNYLADILFDMSSAGSTNKNWISNYSIFADSSSGGSTDPIEISSAKELAYLAYLNALSSEYCKDVYYQLTADIDLGGMFWTPIGSASSYFKGHFDGNGHTIYNLTINSTDSYQGLFGYANGSNSRITDVHLVGGEVTSTSTDGCVGGIVGFGDNINISDCSSSITVTGCKLVGGIAGSIVNSSSITRCSNSGRITASDQKVGGILGNGNTIVAISECSNRGSIICNTSYHAGGIVGCLGSSVMQSNSIKDCYNMGYVTAPSSVGGISGRTYSGCVVSYCYNIGDVVSTSSSNIGAIVGNNVGSVSDCFALTMESLGNGVGGTVKSDTQMRSIDMLELLNDGDTTWSQLSGDYPILNWE